MTFFYYHSLQTQIWNSYLHIYDEALFINISKHRIRHSKNALLQSPVIMVVHPRRDGDKDHSPRVCSMNGRQIMEVNEQ